MTLAFRWQSAPFLACAIAIAAVGVIAALVRGDRVMRLGAIGAAAASLPWAVCSTLAAATRDPALAERLLRLGTGPLALVGPSILLVLLGATGQLERFRALARLAGLAGAALTACCWATDWTVASVRELPSGMYYLTPGPLTGVHFAQLAVWLAAGLALARPATSGGERRNLVRVLLAVLALCAIGASDLLIVYGVAGSYPIAPLCALVAAGAAAYLQLRSDLLRAQGIDGAALLEVAALGAALGAIALAVAVARPIAPLPLAAIAAAVWVAVLAAAWARARERPVRVARERAVEAFAASVAELDSEPRLAERLAALWRQIDVDLRAVLRADGDQLVDVATGDARPLDPGVAAWLAERGELLDAAELPTTRLGQLRPRLTALLAGDGLAVPLVDRGGLVGLVLARHADALREDERGLIAESGRAAARALAYAALSRAAARERETAREVEVAEAMRLQASASRGDELGGWTVAAEYRAAARTTGAGWSASLLADGRLALLVTEAQAHGVAAALATAAVTGAFAAATAGAAPVDLEELLASLRASSEGVVRGGEPVAAFVAILDPAAPAAPADPAAPAAAGSLAWACAGHPGGALVVPALRDAAGSGAAPAAAVTPLGGGGARLGASLAVATRGITPLPAGALLVIASTAVHGDDAARWCAALRELAPAGPRMAGRLVDTAARTGLADEDLLAVVVRRRPERGPAAPRPATSDPA